LQMERYARGISDYTALFDQARPDQLIGEATTSYLWSRTAAQRIAAVQPDARIIAILREPASFLRSLHLQFIRSDVEIERDFGKAMALDDERRLGRRIPPNTTRPQQLVYRDHVRYAEQLARYHAVFPADQILVLIYEDFRADNEGTVRKLVRFLGVNDDSPVETIERNHASAVRSPRLRAMVRSVYLGRAPGARAVKESIKAVTSRRMRHRVLATMSRVQERPPPPADEQLMRELRRRFRGEVQALSDHLGRDMVTFWGYDELG
jgi:Sulfotransferase family